MASRSYVTGTLSAALLIAASIAHPAIAQEPAQEPAAQEPTELESVTVLAPRVAALTALALLFSAANVFARDFSNIVQTLTNAANLAASGGYEESLIISYLGRINPRMPQVRDDLEALARTTALVDEIAPDLLDALATLPAEQRAALVLVDMEGYSVAEAALVLDCAEGTVKSRCSRGRARLAPLLGVLRTPDDGGQVDRNPAEPPDVTSRRPRAPPAGA